MAPRDRSRLTAVSEPRLAVHGPVHVDHHTLWLYDDGAWPQLHARRVNGLVDGQRGGAVIHVGIHTGSVAASVEVHSGPPAEVDTDGWDEVAEVSWLAITGDMLLKGPDSATYLHVPVPPGPYRLRVHARERDHNVDGVDEEPVERYHLVIWPGERAPEVVYQQTDRYGAALRERAAADPPPEPDWADPAPTREQLLAETLRRKPTERGTR